MKSPTKVFTVLLILMGAVLIGGTMFGHISGLVGSTAGAIYLLLLFMLLFVSFLGEGLSAKAEKWLGRKS